MISRRTARNSRLRAKTATAPMLVGTPMYHTTRNIRLITCRVRVRAAGQMVKLVTGQMDHTVMCRTTRNIRMVTCPARRVAGQMAAHLTDGQMAARDVCIQIGAAVGRPRLFSPLPARKFGSRLDARPFGDRGSDDRRARQAELPPRGPTARARLRARRAANLAWSWVRSRAWT